MINVIDIKTFVVESLVAVSAAVAQFVVEALDQLVVVLQLEVLFLYHVVQAVYLGLQPAPLVDELPQPVVLAPDGVAEHAAKEDHFTGLLLYHREELCRVMYPFYFYCLLS